VLGDARLVWRRRAADSIAWGYGTIVVAALTTATVTAWPRARFSSISAPDDDDQAGGSCHNARLVMTATNFLLPLGAWIWFAAYNIGSARSGRYRCRPYLLAFSAAHPDCTKMASRCHGLTASKRRDAEHEVVWKEKIEYRIVYVASVKRDGGCNWRRAPHRDAGGAFATRQAVVAGDTGFRGCGRQRGPTAPS